MATQHRGRVETLAPVVAIASSSRAAGSAASVQRHCRVAGPSVVAFGRHVRQPEHAEQVPHRGGASSGVRRKPGGGVRSSLSGRRRECLRTRSLCNRNTLGRPRVRGGVTAGRRRSRGRLSRVGSSVAGLVARRIPRCAGAAAFRSALSDDESADDNVR